MNRGTASKFGIVILLALGATAAGSIGRAAPFPHRDRSARLNATVPYDPYQGRSILLTGEIDEIHADSLLTLEEVDNEAIDSFLDGDDILVVVGSTAGLEENADVSISGRAYPFDIQALDRFGLDLDAEERQNLIETYSGKAMFVADTVFELP